MHLALRSMIILNIQFIRSYENMCAKLQWLCQEIFSEILCAILAISMFNYYLLTKELTSRGPNRITAHTISTSVLDLSLVPL